MIIFTITKITQASELCLRTNVKYTFTKKVKKPAFVAGILAV